LLSKCLIALILDTSGLAQFPHDVTMQQTSEFAWAYAGECVLCLPLIHRVVIEYNEKVLLLVTVRSEDALELLNSSLPDRVLLARAPHDCPFAVSRFLHHWKPCIGVMMSAWLAPNLVVMASKVCFCVFKDILVAFFCIDFFR
jgi:3-deoxy-D-manno-octulosonic-acid transferase